MTPEDCIFKLGQLEPAEIARVMKDSGVKARRRCPTACAVTWYVYNETRAHMLSTGLTELHYRDGEMKTVNLPPTVQTFIEQFDRGFYPELDCNAPENM